jgi:molybdate transport system substrate-binding protein
VNPKYYAPILASLATAPVHAQAADVIVMISAGFKSTYEAPSPAFEQKTGSRLVTVPGPSEGVTHDTIPNRLARGEPDDVLVMVGTPLDALVKKGETVSGSGVNIALWPIGMAVRAGGPVPDISTGAKLRQVLLDAKSVAYSDSASGVYIQGTLFKKLGIEQQMRGRRIRSRPRRSARSWPMTRPRSDFGTWPSCCPSRASPSLAGCRRRWSCSRATPPP